MTFSGKSGAAGAAGAADCINVGGYPGDALRPAAGALRLLRLWRRPWADHQAAPQASGDRCLWLAARLV